MIHKAKDLSPEQRRANIANQLREYFAEVDANRQHVSPEEADEIISEAIKTSRLGYRSQQ